MAYRNNLHKSTSFLVDLFYPEFSHKSNPLTSRLAIAEQNGFDEGYVEMALEKWHWQ